MKKLLLSLIAAMAAVVAFPQSLNIVACGPAGVEEEERPAVDGKLTGACKFEGSRPAEFDFYVVNNSSQAGTVRVLELSSVNDYAIEHTMFLAMCYNGSCQPASNLSDFTIGANGVYRGENLNLNPPEEAPEVGSLMHLQIIYGGERVNGTAEYRLSLQFEHDAEPSVFYISLDFDLGTGVASAEVVNNFKVYQDGAGNVVADYGFGNDVQRELSIVSLSGQTVYTCDVDGASGNMVLPVNLGKGVYLYSVTEGGNVLSSHKLVVR